MVTVRYRCIRRGVPSHCSIPEIIAGLRDLMGLPPEVRLLVNGQEVGPDRTLVDGDELHLVPAEPGRKGIGEVWTEAEFCEHFQITPETLQQWIEEGLRVKPCRDGSVRISEDAADDFHRGELCVRLNELEREIVRVLRVGSPMTAPEIAVAVDREPDSNLRAVLAAMVRHAILIEGPRGGYTLPRRDQ
jgi:hypothetical protein